MRRGLSLVCALVLALSLTGCRDQEPQPNPSASTEPEAAASQTPAPELTAEPTPTPEDTPPVFDEDHTLDRALPKLTSSGLELPVYGATGYAAVEIGLWEAIPSPTPTPTPTPAATLTPTPTPTPAPTPAPADFSSNETAEPGESGGDGQTEAGDSGEPIPVFSAPAASEATLPAAASTEATPTPTPTPDPYKGALAVLSPGDSFTILKERGGWWQVSAADGVGWVEHCYCMINLPDVIPSMVYDATNSYASLYVSSGREIPGITGEALYQGKVYNPRFEEEQYLMPVLYATAKKICAAQQAALAQGNSLKLYEAYRPYATQRAVVNALTALAQSDPVVKAGISTAPWSMTYFINTGYSNHQKGFAVDVSLVRVTRAETRATGGHTYLVPVEYEEYEMPTAMHELSMAAASTVGPGETTLADTMNQPALALRGYFTQAGMTPLESEWWHFNDYAARTLAGGHTGTGGFEITICRSTAP